IHRTGAGRGDLERTPLVAQALLVGPDDEDAERAALLALGDDLGERQALIVARAHRRVDHHVWTVEPRDLDASVLRVDDEPGVVLVRDLEAARLLHRARGAGPFPVVPISVDDDAPGEGQGRAEDSAAKKRTQTGRGQAKHGSLRWVSGGRE